MRPAEGRERVEDFRDGLGSTPEEALGESGGSDGRDGGGRTLPGASILGGTVLLRGLGGDGADVAGMLAGFPDRHGHADGDPFCRIHPRTQGNGEAEAQNGAFQRRGDSGGQFSGPFAGFGGSPGQSRGFPGPATEAPRQTGGSLRPFGDAPGCSDEAPGHSGGFPGRLAESPRHSGGLPGRLAESPRRPGGFPGWPVGSRGRAEGFVGRATDVTE